MIKTFASFILFIQLCGCTAAGVIIDSYAFGAAQTNRDADLANQPPYVTADQSLYGVNTDNEGFSFTQLGLAIDESLIEMVSAEKEPILECRQITRTIKECEEVSSSH